MEATVREDVAGRWPDWQRGRLERYFSVTG
jgi:hypothetical protein